jgi:hypothetical protein
VVAPRKAQNSCSWCPLEPARIRQKLPLDATDRPMLGLRKQADSNVFAV